MKNRTIIRLSVAATAGIALALTAPSAANAHVTIDPASAAAGGYALVIVKVPNESASATTNRIELSLPTDTPFRSVSYVPVPGWTTELVTTTLPEPVDVGGDEITEAVTSVIWTAEPGSEVGSGQLRTFGLSVGPVPETGSIVMPVDQGYTDGEVVQWNEEGEDVERPAPVLYVDDAPPADHHSGAPGDPTDDGSTDDGSTATATGVQAASAGSEDPIARILGIGGLVVGALGVVLAILSRRSARS